MQNEEFDKTARQKTRPKGNCPKERFNFRDLAMDKHGNLYGLRHNEVRRWSAGAFSGAGVSLFSIPAEDPRAIVIDDDGNIYITFENNKVVRKYAPTGTLLATYLTPSNTGSLIGLDYDPGTQRLFASHTGTGIGQILWIGKNAPSEATMSAFGPDNLSGVRWLAVYSTPEPTTAILLATGLLLVKRRLVKRRFRKGN
ncbi:MAG: PEP-CTERM sorting domain-containing protein [Armatimonadota bacterium]